MSAPTNPPTTGEIPPIVAVLGDPTAFLVQLLAELERAGIDVSALELDHLCYRVASQERFDELKAKLAGIGVLLHEAIIGGRPIATYELREPVVHGDRRIRVVELPSPKAGRSYDEGFEHAEFVIHETFECFMARHPSVAFDTSSCSKSVNPEVRVIFGEISAKFHHQPLAAVIAAEVALMSVDVVRHRRRR